MKIFYDHQAFSLQNFGGVSRIFSELLKGAEVKPSVAAHLSILFSNNAHLSETTVKYSRFFKGREVPKLLNNLYNAYELQLGNHDLYHPSYYDPSLIKFARKKPVVATFHDMIHEKFGEKFPELAREAHVVRQKKEIASRASHIIAVSENTKKDLVDIYGLNPSKITVIHLGSSFSADSTAQFVQQRPLYEYLLYVGNRAAYKNFSFFLKAVASVLSRYEIKLICAGGKGFNEDEMSLIQSLSLDGNILHTAVDDRVLASLYSNAIAFVLPSLYEGFGIPVLEAFSCSCPCILSNTGSLPEVGKDAALYFEPLEESSIVATVQNVLDNTGLRNELINRGRQRLMAFSWQKHVDSTHAVYKELI
jgi:glycosyltransferase involved in cell wall biosynthesis